MDFKNYYNNQANGLQGYYAPKFQRGYGFGSIFKKFFRWVIPILKENATPIIKGTVNTLTSNIGKGLSDFQKDITDDKSIKDSAKKRFDETITNIKNKIQSGSGKRKKIRLKKQTKSYKTIFDKK